MKVTRERESDGVVITGETPQENEVLCYLWVNQAKLVSFERKTDEVSIVLAGTPEEVEA